MPETSKTTDRAAYRGRHRSPVSVVTLMPSLNFAALHCAGTTCVHNHAGGSTPLPQLGRFARLVASR